MRIAALLFVLAAPLALAAKHPPDLGDAVAGQYVGQLSPGGPEVRLTVSRTGTNTVRVVSEGPGFPATVVPLKADGKDVVQASGPATFRLQKGTRPQRLEVKSGEGPAFSGRRLDLADVAQGLYEGDVISDSKGSSKSDVRLTVTRIDVDKVRITSDYGRLPSIDVALELAMGRIISHKGDSPFVLDRSKNPPQLDVSFHNEVSWAGTRKATATGGGQ
jgi:hypothetical protein